MFQIEIDPQFDDYASLLALLQKSFAFMEGRIDPPSSLHSYDEDKLREKASAETLLTAIDSDKLVGCLFVRHQADSLYLGKLAVDDAMRGKGVARQLIDVANLIGRQWSCRILEVETRVELTENQLFFAHLGFKKVAQNSHEGFDRPTSYTYHRSISPEL